MNLQSNRKGWLIAVLSAAIAAAARPADAQAVSGRGGAATLSDSIRILKRARSLQLRFESTRRFQAPFSYTGLDGPCDRIGRFCLHHTRVPLSEIPDEPQSTRRARSRLLAYLDSAAAILPGDDWIAGQRIRYLVDGGNDSAAVRVAGACRATRWWCVALRGLAFHSAGATPASEAAFDSALASMPESRRCEWTDLTELLSDDSRHRYEKLGCSDRDAANRRIWMLSDPLYSLPGNDRRAEHFARHVWAEMERRSANGFGMSWSGDMEEMTVRFGRSEKWTQDAPGSIATLGTPSTRTIAHEREPNFHFLPATRFDTAFSAFHDSSWELSDPMPPEGYGPRYAANFVSIQPQIARFNRGDSTLVIAAYDVTEDTAWHSPLVRAAVTFASSDSLAPVVTSRDSVGKRGTISGAFRDSVALVSVELLANDSSAAGRWRSSVERINRGAALALSDLLLFDATDSLAENLATITRTALAKLVLSRERKTGLYWEMYGLSASDSALPVALTLTPIGGGILRRAIQALGIGRRLSPVNIRWREPGGIGEATGRTILLDLSQIPAGNYELRLEVGAAPQRYSSRIVEIR